MTGYCADCGNTACICPVPATPDPAVQWAAERLDSVTAATTATFTRIAVWRLDELRSAEVNLADASECIERLTAERDSLAVALAQHREAGNAMADAIGACDRRMTDEMVVAIERALEGWRALAARQPDGGAGA